MAGRRASSPETKRTDVGAAAGDFPLRTITIVDLVEVAQAVIKGSKHRVKNHHWAAGMYHDCDICIYCSWYGSYARTLGHDPDCPTHKARAIIEAALGCKKTK